MMSVRKLVFAGALLAVVPFAAVAQDAPKAGPKVMPPSATGPAPTAAPAAPATVKVCKLVPTMVQETRTVMKPVQKTETYTAYRTETVQEKKMVPCTTYKTETYTEMVTKTCCVKVPVYEEKVVMEKRKKIEWVTEYRNKCKVSFTKECKQLGCGNGCGSGCCGDKCGGGCGSGCLNLSIPVYKPHFETVCVPCQVPKCTYECVPVTKKCCTYKTETKTTCVPVCKTRCVPVTTQKEVVTCKKVCVPYQATRCVTVCEPCTETVNVCKMVPTWVDEPVCQNVAPANPCANPCADQTCKSGCGDKCGSGCFNLCGKLSGCCDKVKDCTSNCCSKVKDCCTSVSCKLQNCCGKLKSCFSCK
jgi:hypothetical protein